MSASESLADSVIMTPSEFAAKFASLFEREAFRLELLDSYDSPGTAERVRRFLAGEPDDSVYRAAWDAMVGDVCRAGRVMSRVHVVSEPLTDYLRFELHFYRGSVAAGEDIRILAGDQASGLDLPSYDFWLFDGQTAAVMHYDEANRMLHAELLADPDLAADCRRWRDVATSHSVPLDVYLARRPA